MRGVSKTGESQWEVLQRLPWNWVNGIHQEFRQQPRILGKISENCWTPANRPANLKFSHIHNQTLRRWNKSQPWTQPFDYFYWKCCNISFSHSIPSTNTALIHLKMRPSTHLPLLDYRSRLRKISHWKRKLFSVSQRRDRVSLDRAFELFSRFSVKSAPWFTNCAISEIVLWSRRQRKNRRVIEELLLLFYVHRLLRDWKRFITGSKKYFEAKFRFPKLIAMD